MAEINTAKSDLLHQGRLELLLFGLEGNQSFGINVLKVKEIISCPRLTSFPGSHPTVIGVAELRGRVLPVLDLARALGRNALDRNGGSLIVTELNRSMQAFLIGKVQRIVEQEWKEILPAPVASGRNIYVSGVTHVDGKMVQILDVERVLWEVIPPSDIDDYAILDDMGKVDLQGGRVLLVDDSAMARNQTRKTLERIGVSCIMTRDGREGLEYLKQIAGAGRALQREIPMVISDIEMPEMDGYSLAREIRRDARLSSLYVLLHTSLNGSISEEQALKSGADAVLTKFVPEELAKLVLAGLAKRT